MSFASPWFLAGLLALAVPVFVHLLRRHVTTPRPVSSLMFFERGTQSSTRHRRLRYLVLFAVRSLLVLLLVLAFAAPFFRRSATDAAGRLQLVVVDTSFSMHAGTRFADAKRQALTWLAAKPHTQRAQVIALDQHLEFLTQPTADDAQLRAALTSLTPGDSRANFGELSRAVRSLASTAGQPVDLHLFSDMQRTAMPANFADLQLPENVTLNVHGVAAGVPQPNWTIENIEAPAILGDPKDLAHSRVKAIVAGYNTPAATRTIALLLHGKTIATRRVDVPANGRAVIEFAPLEAAYGFNRYELRILEPDALDDDNVSVFTVRHADPERVLFLHTAGDSRSPFYFSAALNAAEPNRFVLQSVITEQSTDLDPTRFAFVVLSDPGPLPSLFEHALTEYIAKGGNVLITLGARSTHQGHLPVWSGAIREVRDYIHQGSLATTGQMDFTHPILLQPGTAANNDSWSTVRFFYAVELEPKHSRVLARLSDGTPLLLEQAVGEGHVVVFTSGLDNLTNDLPLHPVFVPFVDRLARYLDGQQDLSGVRLVDAFVQLRAAGEPIGQLGNVEVIAPDGQRPLSLSEARTAQSLQLRHAGFYSIRLANGKEAVLGVNPDRRESDLAPIPAETQQLWIASASAVDTRTAPVSIPPGVQRVSLWWYVMLLAMIAAATEALLACGYLGTLREDV